MNVIILLIAISLVIAGIFLFIFLWAMKSGQYDDLHSPSIRMLFENGKKKNAKKYPSAKQTDS